MLQVTLMETTAVVWIDGDYYHLDDNDIGRAYSETADLYDAEHRGDAVVNIAGNPILLSEEDWGVLYSGVEEYLQREFEAFEQEEMVTYH